MSRKIQTEIANLQGKAERLAEIVADYVKADSSGAFYLVGASPSSNHELADLLEYFKHKDAAKSVRAEIKARGEPDGE